MARTFNRSTWAKGLLAGAMAFQLTATQAMAAQACFTRDDNKSISYDVFQVAVPPPYYVAGRDYVVSNAFYPATDFVSTTSQRLSTLSPASASGYKFRKYVMLWVNRCIQLPGLTPGGNAGCRNLNPKGNGYYLMMTDSAGAQIRPAFTTYDKADACTMIQARRVLGEASPTGLQTSARQAGLTIWDGYDRTGLAKLARKVTGPDGKPATYLVDICVLEGVPEASDSAGLVLDYEVWDNRTTAQAVSIIKQLVNLAHSRGKLLIVNTNPMPRVPNGLTADNARQVLDMSDGFVPTVASEAGPAKPRTIGFVDAYKAQLAVLTNGGRSSLSTAEKAKLAWGVALYDLSLGEAKQLHDEFVRQGYRGAWVTRDNVPEGGACSLPSNQNIACLTLGQCSGRFGQGR